MRWGCLVEGREQRITAACSGKEGCCCWQERELLVKQSVHHIFSSNCFDPVSSLRTLYGAMYAISNGIVRYGRYVSIRWHLGMRTACYWAECIKTPRIERYKLYGAMYAISNGIVRYGRQMIEGKEWLLFVAGGNKAFMCIKT
ncbi:hypothetical protein C4D60_Mb02t15420 [Musa balbisiana]|uniref:Uncharacterized protein n=1 Tax=Musa balbisiana TaxID=52838 RepID=A0A4S8IAW5_MUSBA|nr:hypothetical protein C4D60_Mb02t15420 [Musa balbisiana]